MKRRTATPAPAPESRRALAARCVRARRLSAALGFAVFAVAQAAFVAGAWAGERDRIVAFLEVTGFDVAIDSIAESAEDAPTVLGIFGARLPDDSQGVVDEVFAPESMREIAVEMLEETLSEENLLHGAEFYASDLGQRLVKVEIAYFGNSDEREYGLAEGEGRVARMRRNGDPRLESLERMVAAAGDIETAVRAIQSIQARFIVAADEFGLIELEIGTDELRAILAIGEDEARETLRTEGLALAAWIYRDISDDDLGAYAEALETPRMRELYELLNGVQYEIAANRFEELAERLAALGTAEDI